MRPNPCILFMSCACPRSASRMYGLWMENLSKQLCTDRLPLWALNGLVFRLRSVKMEQRKLNDQANSLVDLAKVRQLTSAANVWLMHDRTSKKRPGNVSLQVSNEQTRFLMTFWLCLFYVCLFVLSTVWFRVSHKLFVSLAAKANQPHGRFQFFPEASSVVIYLPLCTIHHVA